MAGSETIVALATPAGKSGVAVIRISGEQAKRALSAFGVAVPTPRLVTLVSLNYNNEIIDKALIIYFPTPNSFTGEDVVEIHCHGSRAVIKKLLDVLCELNDFRLAEPGEFSRRAFFNDKMDLTMAEGLYDLIESDTQAQRKQAMRIMQGEAGEFYTQLRKATLHSLSFLEAYIDFPDEDIPENVIKEIDKEIQTIISNIEQALERGRVGERVREGIHIAIIGEPNVGKSSLLNLLAKREVAIVSHLAGTTRDVIEVHLDINGYSVIMADTAGIREQVDEVESEGIRRSFARAKASDINLIMREAGNNQLNPEIAALAEAESSIIVVNKCDIALPLTEGKIFISVKEKTGIDVLMQAIEAKMEQVIQGEMSFVTRNRHRFHLEQAVSHLQKYYRLPVEYIELKCEELRRAATEIGKITGKIEVEEILGEIFSSFCIGK